MLAVSLEPDGARLARERAPQRVRAPEPRARARGYRISAHPYTVRFSMKCTYTTIRIVVYGLNCHNHLSELVCEGVLDQ